jgi:hypothetical protein
MAAEPDVSEILDSELVNLLGALNTSMTILESFEEPTRQSLYDNLQRVISSLRALQHLTPRVTGDVPFRVLALTDEGRNPDEFARWLVNQCHESSKRVQLKHKWMQYLKDSLDVLIDLNFPDDPVRAEVGDR